MKHQNIEIDIILPWVDGSDPNWMASFASYYHAEKGVDVRARRYRDWGTLPYLFRSIEQFLPWVRTIHFITDGQYPAWLVPSHPKLHWVRHTDLLPAELLPVFNVNPIEVNLHRIEGLSEHFIYLNDDFFFLRPLSKEFFFREGLPVDFAIETPVPIEGGAAHIVLSNISLLNRLLHKSEQIKRSPSHWFSLAYGKGLLNNLLLLAWNRYVGFVDHHLPQPFLKESFWEVWSLAAADLDMTSKSRFRSPLDYTQWLFRYWQLATGRFSPCGRDRGAMFTLGSDSFADLERILFSSTAPMLCLSEANDDFEQEVQQRLLEHFDRFLPQKSTFEK